MKNKIIYGIIAIIVLIGIIMYFVNGFNVGSKYGEYTKLSLFIESGINLDEIKPMVAEAFNGKNASYQNAEYFGEMVVITLPKVSDEEISAFVSKINEKYSLEHTVDDLNVLSMPGLSFYEIIRPYLVPFFIIIAISMVYFAIKYKELGITKMLIKPILVAVVFVAVVMCVYLIGNIQLDITIIPISLFALSLALIYTTLDNNYALEKIKLKEE